MADVIQAMRRRAVESLDMLLEVFNREVSPVLTAVRDSVVDRHGRITSTSADYTFEPGIQMVRVDATDGNVTITLTDDTRMRRTVQKVDSSANLVTIEAPDGYTLHSATSVSLGAQWVAADFVFDEDDSSFFFASTNS